MASDAHAHGAGHHGIVQHQFDDINQQRESFSLGMWLFLTTEIMMFGGLFFAYFLYRWKYDAAFHWGASHQNVMLGTINTCVLLVSSLTMALAVHAAAENRHRAIVNWLGITFILGAAFLGIKAVEWTHEYQVGLVPGLNWTYFVQNPGAVAELASQNMGPQHVMMYFVVYFCMTGLHAIHMIIALGLVAWYMYLGARGAFGKGNEHPVENLGLYWHLIDVIWVFLFPLLYLIDGLKLGGH